MRFLAAVATLYVWVVAAILMFFLYLIGKFFEEKAGRRTYYQGFLIPLFLCLGAGLRYLFNGQDFVGDIVGDALLFGAGISVIALSNYLLHLMVGER
jgi:hypothetical protein